MDNTRVTEEFNSSLELAYGFVFCSYEWMLKRLESIENRIQNFLIFASTVTLGVPLAVASLQQNITPFVAWWNVFAILAVVSFAYLVWQCLNARQYGAILFPNVGKLPDEWLRTLPDYFRDRAIKIAGEHHTANSNLVGEKSRMADLAVWAFLFETVCWIIWACGILLV